MKRSFFAVLVGLAACARGDAPPASGTQAHLAIQGRTNANASIAASGDIVAVAWSASTKDTTDIFAAVSRDRGRTFGEPARVNDVPGDARISSEAPPRIAIVPGAGQDGFGVFVVWTTKRGSDSRILYARSTDGGATFPDRATVPGSEGRGSRGWESIAVDSAGRVYVMWLDHRDVSPMAAEHHHGGMAGMTMKDDPTERAAASKLYFTSLTDSAPV